MKDIEVQLHDIIMERPYPFSIGDEMFYIYPQTLGKLLLTQRLVEFMGVNQEHLQIDVSTEVIRLAKEQKDLCCELMAYMTARNNYYDVFDLAAFNKRKAVFMGQTDEDIASVLILLLSADKTAQFIKHLGIDKEQEATQTIMKIKSKSDKNNITLGGVSIYGTLIDVAMERYKMTKQQVIWEIDYTSLRLLLADRVNSLYLTDDELKKIPRSIMTRGNEKIKATKENIEQIKKMDWK